MLMVNGSVSVNVMVISVRLLINLFSINVVGDIGAVSSNSKAPERRSSAQARMVSAATRKISRIGIH